MTAPVSRAMAEGVKITRDPEEKERAKEECKCQWKEEKHARRWKRPSKGNTGSERPSRWRGSSRSCMKKSSTLAGCYRHTGGEEDENDEGNSSVEPSNCCQHCVKKHIQQAWSEGLSGLLGRQSGLLMGSSEHKVPAECRQNAGSPQPAITSPSGGRSTRPNQNPRLALTTCRFASTFELLWAAELLCHVHHAEDGAEVMINDLFERLPDIAEWYGWVADSLQETQEMDGHSSEWPTGFQLVDDGVEKPAKGSSAEKPTEGSIFLYIL
ncbi:hypothetical protein FB451DRAFT_1180779 [Mycena latifolia]|nr:hypothetical protein FB451DRAFT_1180779 [Mycena latifolia]